MDMVILVLAVLGWVFTWRFGWRIMKWKNRKTAFVETVLLPYIGLLFALFLDQKCPHCGKYIKMSADLCPHCSKDIKTGKVVTAIKHTGNSEPQFNETGKDAEYFTAKMICENCGFIDTLRVRKVGWWDAAWFGIPFTILFIIGILLLYFCNNVKLKATTVIAMIVFGGKALNPDNYRSTKVSCPSCQQKRAMVKCDSRAGKRALEKFKKNKP